MPEIPTDWLDHSARVHPGKLAVADAGAELTYAELRARAGSLAAMLADDGVGPGDPVAIDLPGGADHAVALHGAILAGAVPQSMPRGGRDGIPVAAGARYVGPGTIERAAASDAAWPTIHRAPRDTLTRVLTSGTSGEPRPVELTSANHLWSALASAVNLGVEAGDRWLCCLPLNHVGGLSILLRSSLYGTAAIVHDGFQTDRVATALGSGEASVVSLVATQLVRLLDAGAAVETPRLILVGGGPVSPDVLGDALDRGATVVQTYGLTEACSQVCTLAPGEARERAGSAGRALLGIEVRVRDGEIAVRGPNVAPASRDGEGWLHTGDLGRLDEEGYLWVEGRRSDLIVSGGENVRPLAVEEALREHPGVADVAVVGEDDREWGQRVVAFVVRSDGSSVGGAELESFARDRLQPADRPKRYEFLEELPRTPSGKVLRRALR